MDESTRKGSGTDSADEGEGRFSRAKEYVSDKYASASDTMKNQYNRVREKVDDVDFGEIGDQVRGYVRSNPGKALLISIGVGFLIGLLLRRSDRDEG